MAKSPVNFSKVVDTWRETVTATSLSAGVVLGGEERLVGLAQQHFAAGGTLPATWARPLTELGGLSSVPGELVVLFVRPEDEYGTLVALEQSSARGGVVLAVDEGSSATNQVSHPRKGYARLSFSDTPRGWRRLFETCADTVDDHVVALGRRYPIVRAAAARRVVHRTAAQNALIGATFFLPGADMPAMTLNQVKMILSLAGIYGAEIGRERAVELVASPQAALRRHCAPALEHAGVQRKRGPPMKTIPRPLRAPGHALTLEWSGERGVEASSTGTCPCGWTESASSQKEVRNEYRYHLLRVLGISIEAYMKGASA